jgi:DNA-directed RNA polymerase II subunit RPB1
MEASDEIVVRVWLYQQKNRKLDEAHYMAYLSEINNVKIRGIYGITGTTIKTLTRHAYDGEKFAQKSYQVIITNGSNLLEIMAHPAFVHEEVLSSSMDEMYRMFGIEGARMTFISQLIQIMGKKAPNLRHISLYTDELMSLGKPGSIERAGFAHREPTNILGRAAYGAPVPVFEGAALNKVSSNVFGVFPNQMVGAIPQVGSMYNDVVFNEDVIRKHHKSIRGIINTL